MCFRFIPNDTEAGELRGGPFFRNWNPFITSGHEVIVNTPGDFIETYSTCEVWFVLMPSGDGMADFLCGGTISASVVDYYGDVLRLAGEGTEEMRRAGRTNSPEAWEWWARAEPQENLLKSMRSATLVTTPWPELVAPIRDINPSVLLLPDYNPKNGGRLFRASWEKVGSIVAERLRN